MASRTLRSLILAAWLLPVGCIVGPQEDIPADPDAQSPAGDRDPLIPGGDLDAEGECDAFVDQGPDGDDHAAPDADGGAKSLEDGTILPNGAPIPQTWPLPPLNDDVFEVKTTTPVPSSNFGSDTVDDGNPCDRDSSSDC